MELHFTSEDANHTTIESSHAIELHPGGGGWRFQVFERGTQLWHAIDEDVLVDLEGETIICPQHAIDAAAFLLAGRLRDLDAVLQMIAFDVLLRPDGSMRVEGPGRGDVRNQRQG